MPVHECEEDGKPGYQYGDQKCYVYTPGDEEGRREAKRRAYLQMSAIDHSTGQDGAMSEAVFRKSFSACIRKSAPQTSDMDAIRQYAVKDDLAPEEVYTATMEVANDQYDRSHERFPKAYLDRFAETLPGKSLMAGHNYEELPLGRFYAASVVPSDSGYKLIGKFYVDSEDQKTVRAINLGVYRDGSVGYRAGGRTCDLCGKSFTPYGKAAGEDACDHWPGEEFDGKTCTLTYANAEKAEALETSLVWLGCQYGAQIITNGVPVDLAAHKAAWTKSAAAVRKEIDEMKIPQDAEGKPLPLDTETKAFLESGGSLLEMKALLDDGRKARDLALAEILAKYKQCNLESTGAAVCAGLKNSSLEDLLASQAEVQNLFDQKFPPSPHSKGRIDVQKQDDPTQVDGKPRYNPQAYGGAR